MRSFWRELKKWQQMAAAIATISGVLYGAFSVIRIPILSSERTAVAITYLSNRVDEISYKQDIILQELRTERQPRMAGRGKTYENRP
jgi:hypothetical protein